MPDNDFKVGDQVMLLSGGPSMTVNRLIRRSHPSDDPLFLDNDGKGKIVSFGCQWFSGKKLEDGSFAVGTLKFANDKPDSA